LNLFKCMGQNRRVEIRCGCDVRKFTPGGSLSTSWNEPLFCSGEGIAVNSQDEVYVSDGSQGRILKYTSDGTSIRSWGKTGIDDGEFRNPQGMAFNTADELYVVDGSNNRVQKFRSSGGFLGKWGSAGFGNGQFNSARDVAVDAAGNVYVTDSDGGTDGKERVQVFSGS